MVKQTVMRAFGALPGPIRVAYAWTGLVTAMMAGTLVLAATLGWVLGVG